MQGLREGGQFRNLLCCGSGFNNQGGIPRLCGTKGSHRVNRDGYFRNNQRNIPPRQRLIHHLVRIAYARRSRRKAIDQAVLADVRFRRWRIVGCPDVISIQAPVRVVDEFRVAVRRNDDVEVRVDGRSCGNHLLLAHARRLHSIGYSEYVVPRNHVARSQRLPVVLSVLHVVEQAQLLQVATVAKSTVLNANLQVAVGIGTAAVGLVELNRLQVLAPCKSTPADGDGLVVVVRAHVVVDASHTIVLLQVVRIATLHGRIIDRRTVVGSSQQRARIETLVVRVPQSQLLHHLVAQRVFVGQVCLSVLCQHTFVADTILIDFVARRFVADETVLHGRPHAAAPVVVQARARHTDERVGRSLEHIVPDALHGSRRHRFPVVVATGDVLHQIDLLQLWSVGKCPMADEEIWIRVGLVGNGVAVLEVDALHLRLTYKAVVSDAAQMGVAREEPHQVVHDDHLAIVRHRLLVDGGSGDICLLGIDVPAIFVRVPAIVLRRVDAHVEETRVVVHRDVSIFHTLVEIGVVSARCFLRHPAYRSPLHGSRRDIKA